MRQQNGSDDDDDSQLLDRYTQIPFATISNWMVLEHINGHPKGIAAKTNDG
jgi:hypothetical protein